MARIDENTQGMYGRPMGVVYHKKSNLLFYVDVDMSQLRVLKISHTHRAIMRRLRGQPPRVVQSD